MTELLSPPWWARGTIYQIYPRSFQDSNGDGIGDLNGIERRLSYVASLGVSAVWLSPIFCSPMADFGYDISDYTGIEPMFGTMADFDRLVASAHRLGLKIILDLVPNHTSDQHPWFVESRSSRDNPKRDWYIWRDAALDGAAPNNWMSEFGGSAWTLDSTTGQYYYHAFLDRQPDLNWRNPEVRNAIYDVMRFWLKRGVDGFRVDVLWHLIKDEQFRNNPLNPSYTPDRPPHEGLLPLYSTDRPETLAIAAEMRSVVEEFGERVLIGEIYLPLERLVAYYGEALNGPQLPFNFSLLSARWDAAVIADIVRRYEALLPAGAWPNWVLGNHDRPRIVRRIGAAQARVAAMLLLTLRGTPTMYYGDELGMEQVPIAPDQVRDPFEKNVPGIGVGRDGCRTPMQWDDTANAGFTSGAPWLPIPTSSDAINVAHLDAEPDSLLNLYRALLKLRSETPALSSGAISDVASRGSILSYRRTVADQTFWILLNLADTPASLDGLAFPSGSIIALSTELDRNGERVDTSSALRGNEGWIVRLA
jgi:alpha-glucosidase